MSILITGSSGFLGKGLAERFVDEGKQVVVLSRNMQRESGNTRLTYAQGDITNIDSLYALKRSHDNIDVIVHMAALVPKSVSEDMATEMLDTNVKGTVNLLDVFGDDLRNFVYASTAEVYGSAEDSKNISEETIPRPQSFYGASKLAGEHFCTIYAERLGIPIAILRYTVLYGPGDQINRAIPNFINKALKGQNLEIYGGEELRDYLYVSDAIEAAYLAATRKVNGVYNIGTGKGVAIKDAARSIISLINAEIKAEILPRKKPATNIVLDISKANRELGFNPQYIFPEKLESQIAWARQIV